MKKGVDKRGKGWYSNKAVGESGRQGRRRAKKVENSIKKFLTKRFGCDILNKSSVMAANDKRFQKCKERRKKFLTNEIGCGKIPNVPQAAERVSCKLNNERTKHQTGAHEDVQLKSLSTGVQSITRCLSRVYEAMEIAL